MRLIDYITKNIKDLGLLTSFEEWVAFGEADDPAEMAKLAMFDRSGLLPPNKWTMSKFQLPTFRVYSKSFEDTCYEAANALKQSNNEIVLYWSGGLDSTTVLCSLLAVGIPRSQITVRYTDMSVAELPKFYNKIVKEGFRLEKLDPGRDFYNFKPDGRVILTGEGGDHIFGGWFVERQKALGASFDKPFYERKRFLAASASMKEQIGAFLDTAPFQLTTSFDVIWWLAMVLGWQHVVYRLGAFLDQEDFVIYMDTMRPFYEYEGFQLWSMQEDNHFNKKIPDKTLRTHKQPMKEFIYQFLKDDSIWSKTKIGSLPGGVGGLYNPQSEFRFTYLGRFEDGSVAHTEQELFDKLAA